MFVPPQTALVHVEGITEAKRAEQQREAMAQSEKLRALGQMASGIAHDLNQSLMLVASYSDLARQALMSDSPNMAELEDLLTTTTQAALDGGETVKRLLLFTRAAPEQHNQHVDLSEVIRDAAQLTAPRWRDAAQAEGHPISLWSAQADHRSPHSIRAGGSAALDFGSARPDKGRPQHQGEPGPVESDFSLKATPRPIRADPRRRQPAEGPRPVKRQSTLCFAAQRRGM